MTIQLSLAGRNGMLTGLIAAIGASPVLQVRSGLPPASTAAAATGTVLATANLPASPFTSPAAGVASKSGTWADADGADAAGLACHYRINGSDGTCHLQGLVSELWSASKAYLAGQQVHNAGNVYRATAAGTSAAAGGPAGTGNGIADGGVTWAYVGGLDMVLNNTSMNAGQPFSIDTYTLTAPNA